MGDEIDKKSPLDSRKRNQDMVLQKATKPMVEKFRSLDFTICFEEGDDVFKDFLATGDRLFEEGRWTPLFGQPDSLDKLWAKLVQETSGSLR